MNRCWMWNLGELRYQMNKIHKANTNKDDYCVRMTAIQFHAYQSRCLYLCSLDEAHDVFAVAPHRTNGIGEIERKENQERSELRTRWLYWTKWMHFFNIDSPWPNTKLKNQFKRTEHIWNLYMCLILMHCCCSFIFSFSCFLFGPLLLDRFVAASTNKGVKVCIYSNIR